MPGMFIVSTVTPYPNKRYDLVYMDPPWPHYGSTTKNAAAGKHYDLMTMEEIRDLDVRWRLMKRDAICFCWATCPQLHLAVEAIEDWGLHYRGVAHVWVKTRKDGVPIAGQGIPPTHSKPTSELLLFATTRAQGRPLKLLDMALPQVVLAPRQAHSVKPAVFRQLLERAYGGVERIEMFARGPIPGWDSWGMEAMDG